MSVAGLGVVTSIEFEVPNRVRIGHFTTGERTSHGGRFPLVLSREEVIFLFHSMI